MKRYTLFLGLVLGIGTAAWAQLIQPQSDSYSVSPHEHLGVTAPGITSMRVTTPVNVSITPRLPHPSDEVFVTITGWKACDDYDVDHVDIWIAGHDVMVDLYWVSVPVLSWPSPGALPTLSLIGRPEPGHTNVAYSDVAVVPVPAGPGQQPGKYEITRSLGTFDPGTYTVYVTNHGPVTGDTSASFTVVPDIGPQPIGHPGVSPWWYFSPVPGVLLPRPRPGRHIVVPVGGIRAW